jgi:hypothetical protein
MSSNLLAGEFALVFLLKRKLIFDCRMLKNVDHCTSRFIQACTMRESHVMYQEMVHGVKAMLTGICAPGKTQSGKK